MGKTHVMIQYVFEHEDDFLEVHHRVGAAGGNVIRSKLKPKACAMLVGKRP